MAFGQLSIKGRALRLLSQREHSRSELARKLARHAQDTDELSAQEVVAQTLDELTASGFLSDERAARSVLSLKAGRFGLLKIRQTLLEKGLAPDLIASTLDQARSIEAETAREVWLRKFGRQALDAKERGRQHRFLAGRGFSAAVIHGLLNSPASIDE